MRPLALYLLGGSAGILIACNAAVVEKKSRDDGFKDGPRFLEKIPEKEESERRWLCIADAATGFIFEKGQWHPRKFNVEHEKWIIEKQIHPTSDNKNRYHLKKYGEKLIWSSCKEGTYSWISCRKVNDFLMNTKSKRYIMTYKGSYAYGRDKGGDTPFIQIGKCSPF